MTTTASLPASEPNSQTASLRRLTLVWFGVMFLLFPILVLLGLLMRTGQSNWLPQLSPEMFYAILTLHGLGMAGLWFVAVLAGLSWLMARYLKIGLLASRVCLVLTLVGVGLLIACTLFGRFGTGWYFLYPLPLHSAGVWPPWATGTFFVALALLVIGWLVWVLDLLRAIAGRYPLRQALGWQYLRDHSGPEVPPMILITTVSLIAAVAGLVSGATAVGLFATEWLKQGFANDALLMKNLTLLFGHLVVNLTLYLGVAMLYELMPGYCGRPWKTKGYVVVSWNAVLLLVLLAYFHHLYMDFVQIRTFQVIGQVASYLTSVPAAVASIFGMLALAYGARVKWTIGSALLFLGVLGWTIGGIGAVIDSTIAANTRFHNTLWVPAHFHTYYLMGVVLMILGAVYHVCQDLSPLPERAGVARLTVALLCLGGYGFLLMFYLGGTYSVPRRYASYPPELAQGVTFARVAVVFILLFLSGLALYLWETGRRWRRAFAAR